MEGDGRRVIKSPKEPSFSNHETYEKNTRFGSAKAGAHFVGVAAAAELPKFRHQGITLPKSNGSYYRTPTGITNPSLVCRQFGTQ